MNDPSPDEMDALVEFWLKRAESLRNQADQAELAAKRWQNKAWALRGKTEQESTEEES